MKSIPILTLLTVLALDGVGHAQVICPNQMASQVKARVQDYGPYRRCSVGLTLFGHTFGIVGGRCPRLRLITPAHQACRGEPNPGTYCEYEGTVSVVRQRCDCEFETVIGVRGMRAVVGTCECVDEGNAGTVQDAQTSTCVP